MNWENIARMPLSYITRERLEKIFRLYDQVVGGAAIRRLTLFPIDEFVGQLDSLKNVGGFVNGDLDLEFQGIRN